MVEQIRRVEMVMGSAVKMPNPSEERIKEQVRKSVVAAREIEAGAVVMEEMLTVKRPATGIHPRHLKEFVGRKAKRRIEADEMIKENDFEE